MRTFTKPLAIIALSLPLAGCWTIQSGQKSGILVKVAKVGSWWGVYEGELIRGGFDNGSGASGRSFSFTIGTFRNDLVKESEKLMESSKPVIIKYHCEKFIAPWRGESHCFLDAIKPHENANLLPKVSGRS